jgi:flagellar hook-basal body protein
VYYAKTQNASQADPNNKWQTYVYVGETLVAAALQQATDPASGEKLYVNKYGQLKPESEVGDLLVNAKTQKFSLNQLTDQRASEPATVTGGKAPNLSTLEGINFKNLQSSQLTKLFSIDVDGTGLPVQVGLEHLAGKDMTLSGTEIAKELTNVVNRKFGDERYFNFAGQENFQVAVTNAEGTLTENRTIQLDGVDMTYEQVVNKINSQLNGSSNILSNVKFSTAPLANEFKGYSFTIDGKKLSGTLSLPSPLSTKPMEDLANTMQSRIQSDLVLRLGYSPEAASQVTVNVQNDSEIRVTNGNGPAITNLALSPVSIGTPDAITNTFNSGLVAPDIPGTYNKVSMKIGGKTITDLDISKMDSSTLEAFSKELKVGIQNELVTQGFSSYEAGQLDVKVNTTSTGFTITDIGGHQITQFDITPTLITAPVISGSAAGSLVSLDNVAFADKPFDSENILDHFKDFKVNLTNKDGIKYTKTITFAEVEALDAAAATPKLTNFNPNDPANGTAQMEALTEYMNTLVNETGNWSTTVAPITTGNDRLGVGESSDPLTLIWKKDTNSFALSTTDTSSTFVSGLDLTLNSSDITLGKYLIKGRADDPVAPTFDSNGAVITGGSLTLSNVSFPLSQEAQGDEFESFTFTIDGKVFPVTVGQKIPLDKLILSSSPINDLAAAVQSKIRSTLQDSDGVTWNESRINKITVSVINGKDIKITDAGGATLTAFELTPKLSAKPYISVGSATMAIPKLGNGITASYDPVSQRFSFAPPLGSGTSVSLSGINNQLGIVSPLTQEAGSDSLSTSGAPAITNNYIRPAKLQRYGLKVEYDTVNEKFVFKSGSTGDNSSISLGNPSTYASERFGIAADGNYVVKPSATAVRGIQSQPAIMQGSPLGINANNNFSVNLTNNKFVVSVDDVKGTVYLEPKDTYTIDSFVQALQNGINRMAGPSDQPGLTGSTVSGVKVSYDKASNSLKFTTGTASTNSFIKVSGDSQWGLANVDGGRGSTSAWIKPTQYTQVVNGVPVAQYIDEFGKETFSPDGFKSLPEWSPIFLEKGELTFDTGGNLVSPKQGSQLDTVYLPDGKGALTININYSKSTQFSSPYAVLSQSQDGAPEGDLVGLSVGDDGLVNASYSNGSQKSLGKVVLVNFSNPTGLRQIGDTSYYKSSSSGSAKYGEAGSAGFGTVRSGATERANVDLTQELVDLITEQRNFQANAKAIETSTTLTQSIIQIRA